MSATVTPSGTISDEALAELVALGWLDKWAPGSLREMERRGADSNWSLGFLIGALTAHHDRAAEYRRLAADLERERRHFDRGVAEDRG